MKILNIEPNFFKHVKYKLIFVFRQNWTETYASWSPLGTYLATFHWRGVALWAGPKFSQFQKFFHPEARFISFSPCENYIVTFSPTGDRGEDKKLIIWDIRLVAN